MSQFPDRYPGIKAFEKNEANLFKGREQEVQELFNMVTAENCVVLFGKSGLGKSSLLNAGLSPLLEARGFLPIPVRLQPSGAQNAQTPVSIFKLNIKPYAGRIKCESCPGEEPSELPLWEYLKTCVFPMGFTPVFILDQFENFFSHNSRENQEAFLLALKELLHGEVPVRILNWYKSIPSGERSKEQVAWCNQPEIRVIISIREDRLGDLGFVSTYILHVLRTRYQLTPLTVAQAENAILVPAEQTDMEYASPPFTITEGAKNLILKKLSSGRNTVETTHLQLICHEIECKRKAPPNSAIDNLKVDEEFFEGEQGLDDIINNFYSRQIKSIINDIQREKAKTLLETKMVQNGKRILYSEDQVNLVLGEDAAQVISRLLDLRLIRGDYRDEQKIYEISHDSLLVPILAANKDREELEKELKIQQERAQRQKEIIEQQERIIKLQKQARLKKTAAWLAWICGGLFILAVLLGISFIRNKSRENLSLYKNTMGYAGRYYRDNDHFTSFSLYNKLYSKSSILKDTLDMILNNTFFYDVSGGVNMQVMNDSTFAVYNKDETIYVWKSSANQTVTPLYIGMARENTMVARYPYIAYRIESGEIVVAQIEKKEKDTLPQAMRYEIQSKNTKNPFEENKGYVPSFYFLKGNRFMATTDTQNNVLVYDLVRKKMIASGTLGLSLESLGDPEENIQPSADGNWLAASLNDTIVTWNTTNPGKPVPVDTVFNASMVQANNAGVLVYTTLRQLHIRKPGQNPFMAFLGNERDIQFSPDGSTLLFTDAQQQIRLYSLTENRPLPYVYPGFHISTRYVRNNAFGNRLTEKRIKTDGYEGEQLFKNSFIPNHDASAILYFNQYRQLVVNRAGIETIVQDSGYSKISVGVSPSLDKLAWAGKDGHIIILDLEKNRQLTVRANASDRLQGTRYLFASNSRFFAFTKTGNDFFRKTVVYDTEQQKEIYEVPYDFTGTSFFNYPFLQVNMAEEKTGLVHYDTKLKGLEHYRHWFMGQEKVASRFSIDRKRFLNIF